jgi:AcrR family transcriptional regulator
MRSFRAKGYHRTTLDDIAQQLNVRKTALYHYFHDKEAILYECHRMSLAEVERLLDEARGQGARAGDQLRYIIREHVRVMTETLKGSPSAFEVSSLLPVHQRTIIDGRDRYERGLRQIIQDGIVRGEFRVVEPKTAVFAILGAINWIARWYQPNGALHASDLGTQFAEHLVGGLTCR